MSFFLKISFSLFLVICIVHVAHPLNGASQSQDPRYGGILQYSSAQRRSFDGALVDFEQPRISVYLRDFAGKVIKEFPTDGDNTVTLPEFKVEDHLWQGKAIVLECFSSKYPVLWEYRGVGNPKVQVTTYRQAPDYHNASSYTYGATVTLAETNYRQTGEYVCKGAKEFEVSTASVYLFVPGKKLFVANGDINDTVLVKVKDEADPWVTLPCVVSNKEASVKLFLHTASRSFKPLELHPNSLTFEPKIGFRLKWNRNPVVENPWGYYICQGELVKRSGDVGKVKYEKLFAKLEAPQNEENKRFSESSLKFSFNEESHSLECCAVKPSNSLSERTSLPKMKLQTCTSVSDCYMMTSMKSPSASCEDGNCPQDHSVVKTSETCVAYELPEMNEAGILDCMSGNGLFKERLVFSYDTTTGLVTNFSPDVTRTEQVLYIGRDEETSQSQKQADESREVNYFCNPNSFFFSTGLKWGVERRDAVGSVEFISEDSFPQRPTLTVDERRVAKVYCFAPVWDSRTDWRNVSFPVPMPTTS